MRGHGLSRFHRGVARTVQSRKELAPQRRVELTDAIGLEKLESPSVRVGARDDLFGDRDLARRAQQRQRSGGPEPDAGDVGADPFPQFARPKCRVELVVGATRDPHQPEVPHGGAAGLDLAFEVDDVVAALDRFQRVGGTDDAAADDRHTHVQ